MQPSISLTLEPGLERGVPWGRDLYTFVTSAAGHMMRTLQKPRKNRPSKRQVNHRRFLHNMIQRKFADIEAANHRLASALFSTEEENKSPSMNSAMPDQSGSPSQDVFLCDTDTGKAQTEINGISKSGNDLSLGSHDTEVNKKQQPDSGDLWKSHSKTCTTRKNNQTHRQTHKKGSGNHKLVEFISLTSPIQHTDCYHEAEYYDNENSLKATNSLSEDTLCCWTEKVKGTNDSQVKHDSNANIIQLSQHLDSSISPSFSPQLSPLSLDSCDFSIQMVTDVSTCTQAKKNIADIMESQWTDIMDLFNANDKDLGSCMDMEAYFESICARQGDAEGMTGEACADDVTFVDESESFMEKTIICSNGNCRSEVEALHCERGEYGYEHGFSCQGDQGLTVNYLLSDQGDARTLLAREREEATEIYFTSYKSSQVTDVIPNQLPASATYHYDILDLNTYQCPQQESPSVLINCDSAQTCTPFEGVAQSFPVLTQDPEHCPVPTPPHEDDWLFTDILQDGKSPEC